MMTSSTFDTTPIGRFAPSPSGPLHFGSLIAAVASYCDIHHLGGLWLVRMEDIDPPREQPGAADLILRSLENHGLTWDGQVVYQSQRLHAYQEVLDYLQAQGATFHCYCTRKAVAAMGGIYPGTCRNVVTRNKPASVRLRVDQQSNTHPGRVTQFNDLILGPQIFDLNNDIGDFIIKRKDGLIAYQLAVVVDDIFQNINYVIRGSDLLLSTPPQLLLFNSLNAEPPQFGHIPVANNVLGQKLSKQHHSAPLEDTNASRNVWAALEFLGQNPHPDLRQENPRTVLRWGIEHWQRERIPRILSIAIDEQNFSVSQ